MDIPERYGVEIDIMIEAKMKELSIQKLYEKYPQCNCKIITIISNKDNIDYLYVLILLIYACVLPVLIV